MAAGISHILYRPRVVQTIADTVSAHALTVLAAPAGYGKTTIASELAALPDIPAFTVTIPAGPHNSRSAWDEVLEQMENQGSSVAPILRRHGPPVDETQRQRVLDICRLDPEPLLLIIDDYQNAADSALDGFLLTLAGAGLPGFHIFILSRVLPPLWAEEAARSDLVALFDHNLLAFSHEETGEFFRLHGKNDAENARRAWEYSEGWPAVLWLCLHNPRLSGRPASSPDIERLLAESVFNAYDDDDQIFLMCFSIMEHATAEEAASFTGYPDAHSRLKNLEEKNAFITRDAAGNYRLHSLFRSFLAGRLAADGIDRAGLNAQAGECCLRRGDLMAAFRFFVRAGRTEDQLRLLDLFSMKNGNLLLFLHPEEVQSAVLAIPWHIRHQRPMQYLAFLYYCLAEANDARAVAWLEEAGEQFTRADDIAPAVKARLDGEATLIRAIISFNDLHAMREDYVKAHGALGGRSAIATCDMVWTFGCPHSAYLWLRDRGGYTALVELMERDLHYFIEITGGCGMGGDQLMRGEHHLELCEFDRVARTLTAATRRAESGGQTTTALAAAFSRARLLVATGRGREAVRLLEGWRGTIYNIGHVDLANCLDLSLGYIHAVLGNAPGIPGWLRSGEPGPSQTVPQMAGFVQVIHARALLLAGEYSRLDAVAADIPAHLGPYDNLFGHIHAKALSAAAAYALYGVDAAMEPAIEALELARPDHITLTLAEYGAYLLPMLRRLQRKRSGDAWFATLLRQTERQALEVPANSEKQRRESPLTPRQTEMLRLASRGRTNPEIAQRLGVTADTVKKTLSSAYVKLKARNRADAVQKFAQLHGEKRM